MSYVQRHLACLRALTDLSVTDLTLSDEELPGLHRERRLEGLGT